MCIRDRIVPARLPATPPDIVKTSPYAGKSATTAATLDVGAYDINTAGSAFSFSESWTQGDAVNPIGTGVDVTSGIVADMPAYGETLTMSGGVAGTLAGTITSAGITTLTACLLYTSPSPRDVEESRMPSSA